MTATPHSQPKSLRHAAVALAIACACGAGLADPVRESFDRMLSHGVIPTAQVSAAGSERDPLVAAIVVPLRHGVPPQGPAPAGIAERPADPVLQSFVRMLSHAPGRFTPERPEGLGTDPLIAAIVWPLMRAHQFTVAGVAPVTQR